LEPGMTAEILPSIERFYVMKEIVKNKLIEDNNINPEGQKRMVQIYGNKLSQERDKVLSATTVVVQQNSPQSNPGNAYINKYGNGGVNVGVTIPAGGGNSGAAKGPKARTGVVNVFIIGSQVKINTDEVGSVQEEQKATGGTIMKYKYFYDTSGELVAEATCNGVNCQSWNVTTSLDNKKFLVTTKFGTEAKDIAESLARKGYY
jgi:hypothetical protein